MLLFRVGVQGLTQTPGLFAIFFGLLHVSPGLICLCPEIVGIPVTFMKINSLGTIIYNLYIFFPYYIYGCPLVVGMIVGRVERNNPGKISPGIFIVPLFQVGISPVIVRTCKPGIDLNRLSKSFIAARPFPRSRYKLPLLSKASA